MESEPSTLTQGGDAGVTADPESHAGLFFVAYLDVLGQSSLLQEHVGPYRDTADIAEACKAVNKAVVPVKWLRKSAVKIAQTRTVNIDGVLDRYIGSGSELLRSQSFGDTAVIFGRLPETTTGGTTPMNVISVGLRGTAWVYLSALAKRFPLRGAVEVEVGTDVFDGEVYGQALCRCHLLESHAESLRVVVGPTLRAFIKRHLPQSGAGDMEQSTTEYLATEAEGFITRDEDGKYILDYLGERATWGIEGLWPGIRKRAEAFLADRAEELGKDEPYLADKYRAALRYFANHGQRGPNHLEPPDSRGPSD